MWKRIFSFVLVFSMVFSLFACSRQTINMNPKIEEGTKKLSSVENCCLVLRITVNPQLDIYLDEKGTIVKADAGNKDGEKLLATLELTGLSFADAMSVVLSAAAEQNFLPEGGKVQIEVLASSNGPLSPEQFQQLEQTVTDYNEALASFVDQSIVVAEDCGANNVQVEHMENGDIFYSYFSNMERIREICYGADGTYHEWVYEDRQTVSTITVNADGTRHEEHYSYEDGQMVYHSQQSPSQFEETTFYSDGTQKSHKLVSDDGRVEEQQFYENGNPKSSKIQWSDGSFGGSYFDENGIMTYSYESNDDRNMENYYYTNGNLKSSQVTFSDGTVQEREYYENGNLKYGKDISPDGTVREEYYDESGNRIEN